MQQTKAGLPYYDGNPYDFEQWHFVVMGKYEAQIITVLTRYGPIVFEFLYKTVMTVISPGGDFLELI